MNDTYEWMGDWVEGLMGRNRVPGKNDSSEKMCGEGLSLGVSVANIYFHHEGVHSV